MTERKRSRQRRGHQPDPYETLLVQDPDDREIPAPEALHETLIAIDDYRSAALWVQHGEKPRIMNGRRHLMATGFNAHGERTVEIDEEDYWSRGIHHLNRTILDMTVARAQIATGIENIGDGDEPRFRTVERAIIELQNLAKNDDQNAYDIVAGIDDGEIVRVWLIKVGDETKDEHRRDDGPPTPREPAPSGAKNDADTETADGNWLDTCDREFYLEDGETPVPCTERATDNLRWLAEQALKLIRARPDDDLPDPNKLVEVDDEDDAEPDAGTGDTGRADTRAGTEPAKTENTPQTARAETADTAQRADERQKPKTAPSPGPTRADGRYRVH